MTNELMFLWIGSGRNRFASVRSIYLVAVIENMPFFRFAAQFAFGSLSGCSVRLLVCIFSKIRSKYNQSPISRYFDYS